jgi:predicted RNA binding protein YcfA (HicA-like mRNA interferase family)
MAKIFTTKEMIALIEKDGWVYDSQAGDHCHYKHSLKRGKVTIPNSNKELKRERQTVF